MIINDLDGCYIVFDTKNRNMELDALKSYTFQLKQPKNGAVSPRQGEFCRHGFMSE